MAVQHPLELANGCCDDDGHSLRTGKEISKDQFLQFKFNDFFFQFNIESGASGKLNQEPYGVALLILLLLLLALEFCPWLGVLHS